MRPPKIQRSTLQYPLDAVLGSAAHVRLMRVILHDVGGPVGVTDAARMAGLSTAGARKALEALEGLGVMKRVGTGRAQKYGAAEASPLLTAMRVLFEQEQQQYEQLLNGIRESVAMPEVHDAWLRNLPEREQRTLELDVVVSTMALGWIGPELRTRLAETETRFDVIVEVNTFTRADDAQMPEDALLLWGPGAVREVAVSGIQSHAESADRSRRMTRVIVEMIKRDPSLIRRAHQHTSMLLHEGQGTATADIVEWRQLLETYSADRVRDLLVSQSSRAERLRRSSPFFAILTPDERDGLMREMEKTDEV